MNRLLILAATALLLFPTGMSAQEWDPQYDTLEAAVKTDSRRVVESLGKMTTSDEAVPRILLYILDFENTTQYSCV